MVLILSIVNDATTTSVIEWLIHSGKPFVRINSADDHVKLEHVDINRQEIIFNVRGALINLMKADSLWYRRRGLSSRNLIKTRLSSLAGINIYKEEEGMNQLHDHLQEEARTLMEYIYLALEDKIPNKLGAWSKTSLNKLTVLEVAQKNGLNIPETFISSSKSGLINILEKNTHIINKALANGVYYFTNEHGYYTYTEKLERKHLDELPADIFPSLVQREIRKQYEVRAFYLKGEFYSMAIFSQISKQAKVDFRKSGFDEDRTIRYVPYTLPNDIRDKLQAIFADLDMNTGSVDLMVDDNNEYHFLEINHVGQFGWLSSYCNYYLEKKVAEIL